MPRSTSHIAAVALLFLASMTSAQAFCHGDDRWRPVQPAFDQPPLQYPTLDRLLEATPNIDTSDPATKSFRFTAHMKSRPVNMEMTIAWQRDKRVGMRLLLGEDLYPGWFVSNQEAQLFDPSKGRIYKMPHQNPQFSARVSEKKLVHSFGIKEHSENEDVAPIVLDLKSMIREGRDRARVLPGEAGFIWIAVLPTEPGGEEGGKGGLLAAYEPQEPYRLLQLHVYFAHDQPPTFVISDLSYNDETDFVWPAAPADELLPKEVTIIDLTNGEKKIALVDLAEIHVAQSGLPYIQAGLDHEELRSDETLVGVDWKKTQHFATQVGPKIAMLWRYPQTSQAVPAAD